MDAANDSFWRDRLVMPSVLRSHISSLTCGVSPVVLQALFEYIFIYVIDGPEHSAKEALISFPEGLNHV